MSFVGKGVAINGAGGQDLLGGGLTFKGQMIVPDMAAVRPGGSGALQAAWSAVQANAPGAPWTFVLEGKGEHFATGADDLDQLLGPEPRMVGHAEFVGDVVSFDTVSLTGAKAQASAKGQWKLDGTIRFDLGWQADGPFGLGPFVADGKANGQGTLTGQIGAPRLDLHTQLASINLPNLALQDARLDLMFAQGTTVSTAKRP